MNRKGMSYILDPQRNNSYSEKVFLTKNIKYLFTYSSHSSIISLLEFLQHYENNSKNNSK